MIIAVDFDGTCVTHKFPDIGENIGAEIVLKKLADDGNKIILYTMRSHSSKKTEDAESSGMISTKRDCLQDAIDWFNKYNIPLYGVNCNPTQHEWTDSPKAYAHRYIDDAALGCPLIYVGNRNNPYVRPYVDWIGVVNMLNDMSVIKYNEATNIKKELKTKYGEIY